ncbi:hypothetical protein AWB65_01869 [Caballeronia humi]|jgi:hypothetical protein|uniref:Uncharacterized protein n=1 Tax=Caballeronia humi TaxID=326474 RepID=A0A158GE83_9BURK|nr:hypothetical protein AWB65_01869 [Caballeronia humi]
MKKPAPAKARSEEALRIVPGHLKVLSDHALCLMRIGMRYVFCTRSYVDLRPRRPGRGQPSPFGLSGNQISVTSSVGGVSRGSLR